MAKSVIQLRKKLQEKSAECELYKRKYMSALLELNKQILENLDTDDLLHHENEVKAKPTKFKEKCQQVMNSVKDNQDFSFFFISKDDGLLEELQERLESEHILEPVDFDVSPETKEDDTLDKNEKNVKLSSWDASVYYQVGDKVLIDGVEIVVVAGVNNFPYYAFK